MLLYGFQGMFFRRVPRAATEVRAGRACVRAAARNAAMHRAHWTHEEERGAPKRRAKCPGSAIIGTSKQRCLRSDNFCDLCGLLCQKLEVSDGPGPYSVQPDIF